MGVRFQIVYGANPSSYILETEGEIKQIKRLERETEWTQWRKDIFQFLGRTETLTFQMLARDLQSEYDSSISRNLYVLEGTNSSFRHENFSGCAHDSKIASLSVQNTWNIISFGI